MKKVVSILMIIIVAISCKSVNNQKSDLEAANLKGKVRKIEKTLHKTDVKCTCAAGMKTESNKSKFIYDQKGNLVSSYTIDENDVISDSTIYVYNRRGVCTEMDYYKNGKLKGREVYAFKGGKITGYRSINENGESETMCEYIYSGDEISAEKTYNSNNEIISLTEKELLNGQVVTQIEKDGAGYVKNTTKYTRNSRNDISEYVITDPKVSKEFKVKFEYEYDNSGNWVKKTQLYDDQIVNIVVRNIEYFNI